MSGKVIVHLIGLAYTLLSVPTGIYIANNFPEHPADAPDLFWVFAVIYWAFFPLFLLTMLLILLPPINIAIIAIIGATDGSPLTLVILAGLVGWASLVGIYNYYFTD